MVLAAEARSVNGKVPARRGYSKFPPAPRWALAAVMVVCGGGAQAQVAPPPAISVTGTAEVEVRADMARVTFGVLERADSAAAAVEALNVALSSALEALAEAGVGPDALATTSLRLSPVQSFDPETQVQRLDGYEAESSIELTVRDLDGLGALLDAAVTGGANQINALTFETSRKDSLQDEARRAAVADARARAELYAEAAGVTLGPLLSLSEGGEGPVPPMMRMSMAEADMPILPGALSVQSSVTVQWAIQPGD